MKTILIGILALISTIGISLLVWSHYLRWRTRRNVAIKYRIITPLIEKLERDEAISQSEVETMVRNGALRHATYRVLEAYGRMDLFPHDFLTIDKGAESFLITWLEFPTELGEPPHELELFTTVSLAEIPGLFYYVFRFRMQNNHWAQRHNWIFGVVGPYGPLSKPYDTPAKIFSRLSPADATTAEEEARWVHENVKNTLPPLRTLP